MATLRTWYKDSSGELRTVTEYLAGAPRVYVMKWGSRVSALLLLVVGPILCAAIWPEPVDPSRNADLVPLFVLASLVLLGVYQTANAFISTVTLYQDSVELRTAFSRRSLRFSEIRGRREYISHWGRYRTPYFRLEPNDDRLSPFAFVQAFTFDEAFFQWFNQLPDLDAADEQKWKDSERSVV